MNVNEKIFIVIPDAFRRKSNFNLVGHSCPLRSYPAPVVPIGYINDKEPVAVYLDNISKPNFFPLDISIELISIEMKKKLSLIYYKGELKESLSNFDCYKQKLFALSPHEVIAYLISEEKEFFRSLFKQAGFAEKDPFLRLSLAKITEDINLIVPELKSCASYLQEQEEGSEFSINFNNAWYQNIKKELSDLWKKSNREFPEANELLAMPEGYIEYLERKIRQQIKFLKTRIQCYHKQKLRSVILSVSLAASTTFLLAIGQIYQSQTFSIVAFSLGSLMGTLTTRKSSFSPRERLLRSQELLIDLENLKTRILLIQETKLNDMDIDEFYQIYKVINVKMEEE